MSRLPVSAKFCTASESAVLDEANGREEEETKRFSAIVLGAVLLLAALALTGQSAQADTIRVTIRGQDLWRLKAP